MSILTQFGELALLDRALHHHRAGVADLLEFPGRKKSNREDPDAPGRSKTRREHSWYGRLPRVFFRRTEETDERVRSTYFPLAPCFGGLAVRIS
jgi:hypothetical protein